MHPEVGVRMDDPAFRDIEKLLGRDVEKSEASEIEMSAEIICFYGGGIGAADEKWTSFEAGEALQGRRAIAVGVFPFSLAIEVVVGEEALPKCCDFVIGEAEIAGGNRSAGKSAKEDILRVATKLLTDAWDVGFAIFDGGLSVAPPGHGVFLAAFFDVGHRDPNDVLSAAHAVAEIDVFGFSGGIAGQPFVSGVFYDDGVFLPRIPVGGKIENMVHPGAPVFRSGLANAFSGRWFFIGRHWGGEIHVGEDLWRESQ